MLRLSNAYYNQAILSLRTGGKIGTAVSPIINPNNLKLEGWYVQDSHEKGERVLPMSEVRDFIAKGIVVNDHDALTETKDMVRLEKIIELRFELIKKSVYTESRTKLGKVEDFAVNDQNNYVQKLYINPPILKGLTQEQLMIDRSAIVEITDKKIVVVDETVKSKAGEPAAVEA